MPARIKETLIPKCLEQYKTIAKLLASKENLFVLAKGVGLYVANYIALKFF